MRDLNAPGSLRDSVLEDPGQAVPSKEGSFLLDLTSVSTNVGLVVHAEEGTICRT